jgi:signal transduction histidine kinase
MRDGARGPSVARMLHRRHTFLLDVMPAGAFAVFLVVTSELDATLDAEHRVLDARADVLLAVIGLTLVLHRRAPVAGHLASLALTLGFFALDYPGGPVHMAPLVTLLPVIAAHPVIVWLPLALGGAAALTGAGTLSEGWDSGSAAAAAVWLAVAVAFGAAVSARRHGTEVGRVQLRERAAEERLRIARDLHDVVGHSLSTISLHAGVAERALDTHPEQVRDSVAAIRQTSREALGELRAVLGILRDGGAADRAPTPGLDAIGALVDGIRDAGLQVDLDEQPVNRRPPDLVGTAAYRIVQEALTNVARHAGPGAAARVRVAAGRRGLLVEVADDGAGAGSGWRPGNGITGMRERAAAVGGVLDAGPARRGGFRVRAQLPIGLP